jgi:NAD(P)-dependent dehydrogenase (short-subunit alcohol dehydrogenase family)
MSTSKVVIVNGVSSAIGRATADKLAQRGCLAKGQASLLSKLRRYMPAGPVDANLRKTFGLA